MHMLHGGCPVIVGKLIFEIINDQYNLSSLTYLQPDLNENEPKLNTNENNF